MEAAVILPVVMCVPYVFVCGGGGMYVIFMYVIYFDSLEYIWHNILLGCMKPSQKQSTGLYALNINCKTKQRRRCKIRFKGFLQFSVLRGEWHLSSRVEKHDGSDIPQLSF